MSISESLYPSATFPDIHLNIPQLIENELFTHCRPMVRAV